MKIKIKIYFLCSNIELKEVISTDKFIIFNKFTIID